MEEVITKINEMRDIKKSSLNAYIIALKKLNDYMTDGEEFEDLDFLLDEDKVIEFIETSFALTTQKNYLTAIVVALSAYGKEYENELIGYRNKLDDVLEIYNKELDKNKKTKKQENNWISMEELREIMDDYKNELQEKDIFKKNLLTRKEFDLLQRWVVANLYVNKDAVPVRLDYGNMRVITNEDYDKLSEAEKKNNFLVVVSRNSKFFSFGNYKTERKYKLKKIDLGKNLNSVINIWLKYNKHGSLLLDSKQNTMSPNQLGKYIKKTFSPSGKEISVNIIRHVFISEHFPAQTEKDREKIADKMMHSVSTQKDYAKLD